MITINNNVIKYVQSINHIQTVITIDNVIKYLQSTNHDSTLLHNHFSAINIQYIETLYLLCVVYTSVFPNIFFQRCFVRCVSHRTDQGVAVSVNEVQNHDTAVRSGLQRSGLGLGLGLVRIS